MDLNESISIQSHSIPHINNNMGSIASKTKGQNTYHTTATVNVTCFNNTTETRKYCHCETEKDRSFYEKKQKGCETEKDKSFYEKKQEE